MEKDSPTTLAKILLVDDHEKNLFALKAALMDLEREITLARSGEEALKCAFNDDFAVVLLDVAMPGIDGFETAQILRRRQKSSLTPIIFLTAFADGEVQKNRAYIAGAVDFIVKPIEPEILRSKVSVFVVLYEQKLALQRQAVLLRRSMLSVVEEKKWTKDEKKRREELEQFTHIASHDLKEPLRAVNTFAQLLGSRYGGTLASEANEFIEHIVGGATKIYNLIDNLVEYADLNSEFYKFGTVDCNEGWQSALVRLEPELARSRAVITADPLPPVYGNSLQLAKLFECLLSNSLKFRRSISPEINLRVTPGSGGWLFELSDNGIGFEQQFAERVFLLFKRLHSQEGYAGTGFGLAMCKRIVERHRGQIWLQSEPDKGTTVYFTLPFAQKDTSSPHQWKGAFSV